MRPGGAPTWAALPAQDREFRARFHDLLLAGERGDHLQGWDLARDVGRAAAPMLWDLQDRERSDIRRRMVLLVAAALAGGEGADQRLLQALEQASTEERVLGAMLLALGPRRTEPVANLWQRLVGERRSPLPILQVAGWLAASRFPGGGGAPAPAEVEPGLMAAACAAGIDVGDRAAWFPPASPPRNADLVWRASFLAPVWGDALTAGDPLLLQRAEHVLQLPDRELHEARIAAALLLGRTGRVARSSPGLRPPGALLEAFAGCAPGRQAVRDWLQPVPNSLDERPRPLAVAYVLSRDIPAVLADIEHWSAVPAVRQVVTLALAHGLLATDRPVTLPPAPPDLPEWFWVEWAAGQEPGRPALSDPHLQAAAEIAKAGRLPRPVAREQIEQALWRADAHPGLALRRAQLALVRDLLLAGSHPGAKYSALVRQHERYLPKGLGPEDPMFVVAVNLFDLLSRPEPPLPRECRLR